MLAIARNIAAMACGIIFSLGLILGGMLNPSNVLAFLDISENWNPSLAFVLGGAVCVTFCGIWLQKHLSHPLFDTNFQIPTARQIDGPLIAGSCLFGLGWGLVGFCPGPAIASIFIGQSQSMIFLLGLVAGTMAFSYQKYVRQCLRPDR
ncbi:YeeE/YedE family protein [Gluconobacter aidae]|uniref:YeeE/YedE family protein n=1 Tax=Gluconobacter aidae TaxID=2662454 RepID=A0A7X1SQ47_9PROT|nr:YeeE/YedE family protein [Gluconobacter aidae]MQR99109.1 YeeE/YedE family protein [Gluconobacter aidae]